MRKVRESSMVQPKFQRKIANLGRAMAVVGAAFLATQTLADEPARVESTTAVAKQADDKGWLPLFNGRDLDGFDLWLTESPTFDKSPVFQVQDGVIHVYRDTPAGAPVAMGVFATKKEYSRYHLRFQYKWGEKKFAPRTE